MNSYRDTSDSVYFGAEPAEGRVTSTAPGFGTVYKAKIGGRRFADLLDKVSLVNPEMRIRFMSPHPKVNDQVMLSRLRSIKVAVASFYF